MKDVKANEPEATVKYIHVRAQDGTTKTFTVKIKKLSKDKTIINDGVIVQTTSGKQIAKYDANTSTYRVKVPYDKEGAWIKVIPNNKDAYIRVGDEGDYKKPEEDTLVTGETPSVVLACRRI